CPELLVGLLGILKAGAAYVPLDPAYPDERLAFLLDDTAAPLVLAHGPTAGRLRRLAGEQGSRGAGETDGTVFSPLLPCSPAPLLGRARVLCLDAAAAQLDAEPDHNPAASDCGLRIA